MKRLLIFLFLSFFKFSTAQVADSLLSSEALAAQRIYGSLATALQDYKSGIPVYRLFFTINSKQFPLDLCKITTLQELQLSGEISYLPLEIRQLSNLQSLDFNWNAFSTFPVELCELENLTHLKMAGFGKKEIAPCFSDLKKLKHLILTNYNFSVFPTQLTQLTAMETLVLSDCNIKTLPEELFLLPNLKKLYLADNRIGAIPASISNATNLEVIELSGNKLPHKQNKVYLSKSEVRQFIQDLNTKK